MAGFGTVVVWLSFALALGTVAGWAVLAAGDGSHHRGPGRRSLPPSASEPPTASAGPDRSTAVTGTRVASWAGALLIVASLFAPWIQGRSAESGEVLVLTGWSGLDPLTVTVLVVGAGLIAGRAWSVSGSRPPGPTAHRSSPPLDPVAALLGVATIGLIAGNLAIQLDQPGGSRVVATGFLLGLAGAVLVIMGAALAERPSYRSGSAG